MSFSCLTYQINDIGRNFPESNFLLLNHRHAGIQDLIKRVSTVTQKFPQHFKALLEGICHPNFKVTIYDGAVLQDLQKLISSLMKEALFKSLTAHEKAFWQNMSDQLDQLIQEKATPPLLHFPLEILFQIVSYLPLKDISSLVQGLTRKISNQSQCVFKDLLSSYPSIFVEAPHSNLIAKAHFLQKLSKEWLKRNNLTALSKLFTTLNSPRNLTVRYYYLSQMTNHRLFDKFLKHPTGENCSLFLDISPSLLQLESKQLSPLLYPLAHLNDQQLTDWQTFMKAYSNSEHLTIKTQLHDHLTAHQEKHMLLEIMNKELTKVTHLKLSIQNFGHSMPVFYPPQIQAYQKFIYQFPHLHALHLTCIETKRTCQQNIYRKISTLASQLEKLLHPQLSIQSMKIDLKDFPNSSIQAIEGFHWQNFDPYSIYYLNLLTPVLLKGLTLNKLTEIQLIVSKSLRFRKFENLDSFLNEVFHLPHSVHKQMKFSNDGLVFIFRK
jgi:hypothetical protein